VDSTITRSSRRFVAAGACTTT